MKEIHNSTVNDKTLTFIHRQMIIFVSLNNLSSLYYRHKILVGIYMYVYKYVRMLKCSFCNLDLEQIHVLGSFQSISYNNR